MNEDRTCRHTTYRQARRKAADELSGRGVPDADIDARILLEYASSMDRTQLLLREEEEVPEAILSRYWEAVRLRSCRVPLQHITGEAVFCGIRVEVSDQVLTPRQDTEILEEEAVKRIRVLQRKACAGEACGAWKDRRPVRVLDLCTGSGCLIIAAAKLCPGIEAVGADISGPALDIARRNAENSGTDVTFLESDLFEKVEGTFDVILSNPPYIRTGDIGGLMDEVRDHEPHMALDGGPDGLSFYRRIVSLAPRYLNPGGCLLFEIGFDEGQDVTRMLREAGFGNVRIIRDLNGLDRVISSVFPGTDLGQE